MEIFSPYNLSGFSTGRALAHAVPSAVKAAGSFLHAPSQCTQTSKPINHSFNKHPLGG